MIASSTVRWSWPGADACTPSACGWWTSGPRPTPGRRTCSAAPPRAPRCAWSPWRRWRRRGPRRSAPGGACLLVRDLATARALVEAGATVRRWTRGGPHHAPGKTKVNEYIYLDAGARAAARSLLARGGALEAQDVPGARPEPLATL